MSIHHATVLKLYHTVIDDVIEGVRDSFTDEGVDDQVLQELKNMWEAKLAASKAIEPPPVPEPTPPVLTPPGGIAMPPKVKGPVATSVSQDVKPIVQQNAPVAELHGKLVPLQLTLPPPAGAPDREPKIFNIQVPSSALSSNQLQHILTPPIIQSAMALPVDVASNLLQQHITSALRAQAISNIATTTATAGTSTVNTHPQPLSNGQYAPVTQVDGKNDSSDDDDEDDEEDIDDDDDDEELDDKDDDDPDDNETGVEDEPLNSNDDESESDTTDLFDTENVVVCQYDKITRSRNKWKFYLKDGIMNLDGRDYVFQKASGDAEW